MHVIIVGAGPCGLSLSLILAEAGIEVSLLDKGDTIDSRPRAVHLVGPAIQLFRRAGVLEDVRRNGFLPQNWTFRKIDGTPIATIEDIAVSKSPDATTVLPSGMLCEVLLSHAEKKSNISLHWSHQVVDVGRNETSAWAIAQTPEGTEKIITGDFLCGCDGGTSQVRKSLLGERNFPGKTWDVQFVATDVYYPFDKYGFDDVNAIVDSQHYHLVARLTKDGLWRVAYREDKNMTLQEILDNQPAQYERLLPGHPRPGEYIITNISSYKLHQRCAERFRVGRICLAGDAAHLCNPWGGLGLTGGFADVIGLAECLEGYATGQADEDILDKYDEMRRSIFHGYIDPISTANYLRVSALGTEDATVQDPFIALCVAAKRDPKLKEQLKEQMEKSIYATCHDFTQYYHKKA